MSIKIIGAVLIIAGCGGVGFSIAAAFRREEVALEHLIAAAQYMCNELQYRQPALPELCRLAASQIAGSVSAVLNNLASELDRQVAPNAALCMAAAIETVPKLPECAKRNLTALGRSLGRFDLPGQLSGLQSVCELAKRDLSGLQANRDVRLRSYQTLGLCAGAALVILFI